MDNAKKTLNSLTKDFSYEKLIELLKKYKYYIIGAVLILILLMFKSCGGGLAEAHQKHVGEWKFTETDAKDGFFWAEKDIKTLTLHGNGTWNLNDDKAYGDWGVDENDIGEWDEDDEPYESFLSRKAFQPNLHFRENNWTSNNAERIVDMEGWIDTNSAGEYLALKITYRYFGNRLVDEGYGAEIETDVMQKGILNYYFVREEMLTD